MTIFNQLFTYQQLAANQLKTGSILCGGVGSGKSITSLWYYNVNERPKNLYIITTAFKRDTLDWERECTYFMLSKNKDLNNDGIKLVIDSWNNIKKYIEIKDAFFIFDEQRVIGTGSWVKSFIKITKNNNWILLSATPGDTWMDYVPVFIANGFYKNRTDFIRQHVIYNTFTKFPKVDRYIGEVTLEKLKNKVLVKMDYDKKTAHIFRNIIVTYNKDLFETVSKKRWNPYEGKPIKEISSYCYILRKVVNSDISRIKAIKELLCKHNKIIIFYNFNYELDLLRSFDKEYLVSEHNGHKHDPLPEGDKWIYLVQYTSGSEGWNCITTDTIIFYSLNYSYRIMTQAAGRIDRLNTPYTNLYYYTLRSMSPIDNAINKALKNKKVFNQKKYFQTINF